MIIVDILSAPYCKVTSPSSNVTVDTKVAYLPRGQVINYACANGTELLGGDLSRICEDSGWLSGKVPICGGKYTYETFSYVPKCYKSLPV